MCASIALGLASSLMLASCSTAAINQSAMVKDAVIMSPARAAVPR